MMTMNPLPLQPQTSTPSSERRVVYRPRQLPQDHFTMMIDHSSSESSSPAFQFRRKKTAAAVAAAAVSAGSSKKVSLLPPTAPSLVAAGQHHQQQQQRCRRSTSSSSQRIPVSSQSMRPTAEEREIHYEEQMAEHRDYVFYSRVVNGILSTQRHSKNYGLCLENEQCLSHVIETRAQEHDGDDDDDDGMFSTSSGDDFAPSDDDCIFHLEL